MSTAKTMAAIGDMAMLSSAIMLQDTMLHDTMLQDINAERSPQVKNTSNNAAEDAKSYKNVECFHVEL
jgi:hypothetical protein